MAVTLRNSRVSLCLVSASISETSTFFALRISKLGLDFGRVTSDFKEVLKHYLHLLQILESLAFIHAFIHSFSGIY